MGQSRHQSAIGLEEVVPQKLAGLSPHNLLEGLITQCSCVARHLEKDEADLETVGVGILKSADLRADLGVNGKLFLEFPAQASPDIFSGFDLPTGKFPLEWKGPIALALADEDASVLYENAGGDSDHL
jgi:hypothetical protein